MTSLVCFLCCAAVAGATPGDAASNGGTPILWAAKKSAPAQRAQSAWAELLDGYFDANLADATFDRAMEALIGYTNRRTLSGASPIEERKRFDKYARSLGRQPAELAQAAQFTAALYTSLLDYLQLEMAYREKPDGGALERLIALVELHAGLNPAWEADRGTRIVEAVRAKQLFVPSTILFGSYLFPYRAQPLPAGVSLLPWAGRPDYQDEEHRAEARFVLGYAPGPIARIDFETVGTAALRAEVESQGIRREMGVWKSSEHGGLRPPILVERPFTAANLVITVEAPAEQAVLRDVQVCALKEATAAVCPWVTRAPLLDGIAAPGEWSQEPQVQGFVRTEAPAFAEAQTQARLARSADTLFVVFEAAEPRLDTMKQEPHARDGALWDEESVELCIATEAGNVYRFLVSVRGDRYDSFRGDAGWDGAWQAAATRTAAGWGVELGIPFETLGGAPGARAAWKMNFLRHRRNVVREDSVWVIGEDMQGQPSGFGVVALP